MIDFFRGHGRLVLMMFGQYLVMGTWAVTLATWLLTPPTRGGLDFPPALVGWVFATFPLAGLLAPPVVGPLMDRFVSAQKLLAVMHLAGGVLLVSACWWCQGRQEAISASFSALAADHWFGPTDFAEAERACHADPADARQTEVKATVEAIHADAGHRELVRESFLPLFLMMLAYCWTNVSTNTLTNVIALRGLADPKHQFGRVRLWGTVGWIVAGLLVEWAMNPVSPRPLAVASGLSFVMAAGSWFLPATPPSGRGRGIGEIMGLRAFRMLLDPNFRVVLGCAVAISVVQQFYTVYCNKFLGDLGVPSPSAVQTVAQTTEVLFMAVLPSILHRFGVKWTMAIGLFGFYLRNALFALGDARWVVGVGLPLHGLSYVWFLTMVSIYADQHAPPDRRGGVQSVVSLMMTGIGALSGNYIASWIVASQTSGSRIDWFYVWAVPAALALVVTAVFVLLFRTTPVDAEEPNTAPQPGPPPPATDAQGA